MTRRSVFKNFSRTRFVDGAKYEALAAVQVCNVTLVKKKEQKNFPLKIEEKKNTFNIEMGLRGISNLEADDIHHAHLVK